VEEGELSVDFDGRNVNYGFGELDELVLAYATTIHKEPGVRIPRRRDPADDAALPDAAAEPGLYWGDARQAPRRARRLAKGARYCGQGEPSEAAVVKAAGVADRQRYASTKRFGG
jgi:hypothetical protein